MSTTREELRSLVYELCEPRKVPLLVTDMIADHLDHRDLFNINTLSRSLNAHANAYIYRDVVFNLDGSEQSIEKASLLLRTLLTSDTAAQAVRTVFLVGVPLEAWRLENAPLSDNESIEEPLRGKTPPAIHADLTQFTLGEVELYHKVAAVSSASMRPLTSQSSIPTQFLHALHLMPNLEDLSVSADYFRFPDFRNTLQDMARDSTMKLRSCRMCLDLLPKRRPRGHWHPVVVRDWDSALLSLLAVPGIQSIAAVASLKSEVVRQLRPGGSSITRLDLYIYQKQELDVSALLAATPNLRYLKYHACLDHSWYNSGSYWRERQGQQNEAWVSSYNPSCQPNVGLEPLYDALHHLSDSLQELHMSQDFGEDSIHFGVFNSADYEPLFRRRGKLLSLKHLRTLTIPYATILGWTRKEYVSEWDEILPPSLRHIVLTDDLQNDVEEDSWTDEDLMPIFSRLAEWLSAKKSGNETTSFGLHVNDLAYEFNEPVQQKLTRICEECGVQSSIQKKNRDHQKSPPGSLVRTRGGRWICRSGRGHGM